MLFRSNLTFRFVESDGSIRIGFDNDSSSWSVVGTEALRVNAERSTINLSQVGLNAILLKEEQEIVLHEFVHALGLFHEYGTLTQWPTSGDTGNVRSSEGNI